MAAKTSARGLLGWPELRGRLQLSITHSQMFAAFRKAGVQEELAEAAAEEPVGLALELKDRVTRLEVKMNVLLTINVAILLLLLRDSLFG